MRVFRSARSLAVVFTHFLALMVAVGFLPSIPDPAFAALPDLTVQSFSVKPREVKAGDLLTISVTVKNTGKKSAPSSWVALFGTTEAARDLINAMGPVSLNGGPLTSGASATVIFRITVPSATPGVYAIYAKVDPNQLVAESRESNNISAFGTVTLLPPSLIDLSVQSFSVTPSTVKPGDLLTVTVTVKNIGTASAPSSWVALFGTTATATDLVEAMGPASLDGGPLAPNASATVTFGITVPSLTPGEYVIYAKVDPNQLVAESRESNNISAFGTVTLLPPSSSASLTVWVVDSLTRVQPTDPPGPVAAATLKAARNEFEIVQVVIRAPASTSLTGVNVTVSDLVGPGIIAKNNVALYRAHYIPVTQPTRWDRGDGDVWASPHPPGDWPDALVSQGAPGGLYQAFPFDVPAGRNQPVWVEVYVPKGTPGGLYTGSLTVTASGAALVSIPLTLTVWGFTLPDQPTQKSDFGGYDTWFFLAAQAVGYDQAALMQNLYQQLSKHRIGIGTPYLNCYFDEPPYGSSYQDVLNATCSPRVVTVQNADAWDVLDGFVDIWVPVFYEGKYRAAKIAEKLARGQEVWSYGAGFSPNDVPSWVLDYDLINFRIPAWLNYRRGQTGLLFWTTAYWQTGDPWLNQSSDPDGQNLGGTLFYPGHHVGWSNTGVPSARLKAIRDGFEDYEYLATLARLGDGAFANQLAATLAPAWDNWNHDPNALALVREQAALRIRQLGGQ